MADGSLGQGAVRGTVGFDSVRYSDPGAFGETVAVGARDGVVRVEVTDRAGWGRGSSVRRAVMPKRAGASARCEPRCAVGVEAARRADGDGPVGSQVMEAPGPAGAPLAVGLTSSS